MKYLINLTAPVSTTISADSLRGEPRWERNVFAACLKSGRQVHTTAPVWSTTSEKPSNLHDGLNTEWQDDSVLLTYGVPQNLHIGVKAKYYVVQMLDDPFANSIEKFNSYLTEKPGSIIASCGYKSWIYMSRIEKAFGSQNVELVQGPVVPYVVGGADNFNKPNLLWAYRNFWDCSEKWPKEMGKLFSLVESFLAKDLSLKLVITLGAYRPKELSDPVKDGKQWVMSRPFMGRLAKYEDRIDVVSGIHWHEMLELFSQTRLVVSPPEPLGYPPYEAAMYGVPTVLRPDNNPFLNSDRSPLFPEVLTAPEGISARFLELIGRLFTDHPFYRKHGDAYRNYVSEHATYDSYIKQLDEVFKRKGWVV